MTAIAGESGSGKTTLARILLGFIPPSAGEVIYRGRDLARMSGAEQRQFRREVQPVFQDPFDVFNPFYRVDHVLHTPLRRYKLAGSPAEERAMIEDALSRVGLRPADTLGRYPHELSGGQRQRVMVARAVLLRPRIIVADEPVSMVDASLRATILDELRTLNRDLGISIVYITHDLTTAFQICDNILILYKGEVAEAGVGRARDRRAEAPLHAAPGVLDPAPRPLAAMGNARRPGEGGAGRDGGRLQFRAALPARHGHLPREPAAPVPPGQRSARPLLPLPGPPDRGRRRCRERVPPSRPCGPGRGRAHLLQPTESRSRE